MQIDKSVRHCLYLALEMSEACRLRMFGIRINKGLIIQAINYIHHTNTLITMLQNHCDGLLMLHVMMNFVIMC